MGRRGSIPRHVAQLLKHLIHLIVVNACVIPCEVIAVLHAEHLQMGDQFGVPAVPVDSCHTVEVLFVVDPETGAPCLPVCPSVVGGCGHVVRCLFDVYSITLSDEGGEHQCDSLPTVPRIGHQRASMR